MGSAWNYSAKECSADGKFSAEFDGLDLAMSVYICFTTAF